MTSLLEKNKINKSIIEEICKILVNFYNTLDTNKEISFYGGIEAISKNILENFEQTKDFIGITISKKKYDYIKEVSKEFLKIQENFFKKRICDNKILDCHGDLHSGNIVVDDDKIYIFDCIEFNKRFRFCDCASDIGFLSMDLDYLNHPFLSSFLINEYIERSDDYDILKILNFYKSYRSYVRGKVLSFQLNDKNISEEEKDLIIKKSKKYFELSKYYTSLLDLQLKNKKPLLFMICGLTGTGKSTIANKISIDYNATIISTDVIRKEILGIFRYEKHFDKPDNGLYSAEKVDYIYSKLIDFAYDRLKKGENIVLDATFQKRKHRKMVKNLSKKTDSLFLNIHCISPDNIVKKWLEKRLSEKTASDGRWEIYLLQKKRFEHLQSDEKYMEINTSMESYNERFRIFKLILSKISEELK
jgi:predicted kinase